MTSRIKRIPQLFSQTFSCSASTTPQAMSQAKNQAENVEQLWSQHASKVSRSGCVLGDRVTLEQLSNHEFKCTQDKRDLLAGMLFAMEAKGKLWQVVTSSQIVRKQRICETITPFNRELSKMYEAGVHVLSDSILCMVRGAMNEPDIKFTKRWNDCLEQYRKSARRIDREQIQFVFHIFLAQRRTRRCARLMTVRQHVTPETCPHRVLIIGMMHAIPISSQGPKEGTALFLQDAERNAACFEKFKPGYFMYIGPGSEKTCCFEKYFDDTKKENEMNWQNKHPILKGCINFRKGKLKKVCQNIHFDASDPSIKVMMDFTSSANDMYIVFRICDCLGNFQEIDLGSRRNTASVVLTPRISVTINLSGRYAANNFSCFASAAERTLIARASYFDRGREKLRAISESSNN